MIFGISHLEWLFTSILTRPAYYYRDSVQENLIVMNAIQPNNLGSGVLFFRGGAIAKNRTPDRRLLPKGLVRNYTRDTIAQKRVAVWVCLPVCRTPSGIPWPLSSTYCSQRSSMYRVRTNPFSVEVQHPELVLAIAFRLYDTASHVRT